LLKSSVLKKEPFKRDEGRRDRKLSDTVNKSVLVTVLDWRDAFVMLWNAALVKEVRK
jgi:hypothetical protein